MGVEVRVLLSLQVATLALWVAVASGKLCGDSVDGHNVPCACGDTVVSDVVLADDPVTQSVCPSDGLIVRAADAAHGVTIDLHGHTLRGSGSGTGVWILYGGPGGARLVSADAPALVEGFEDGVVAQGSDSVALIEGLRVRHSAHDGVRVRAENYRIHATDVETSGRDGFSLDGHGFEITATHAFNSGRFGYFVVGENGLIGVAGAGNRSEGSGHAGFRLSGNGHQLIECAASAAGDAGVQLNGMHYTVSGCVAERNLGDGMTGIGMDWHLSGNRAMDNGNNGLVVRGAGLADGGGNRGARNRGRHEQTPAQCEINGIACTQ